MFQRLVVIMFCLCLALTACQESLVSQAKQEVPIGMRREEAINVLSPRAWYHQSCMNQNSVDDLFFYGSRQYDRADLVIVNSAVQTDTYRVALIGTLEPNAWHAAYKDCVQRSKFEN